MMYHQKLNWIKGQLCVGILILLIFSSCKSPLNYDRMGSSSEGEGGFQKIPFVEQETAPGMVLIEGKSINLAHANGKYDTLQAATFYISKYQETNGQYLTYLNFIKKHYSEATYKAALPDTTVWVYAYMDKDLYFEKRDHYLRDAKYRDFPVVGVSADQIKKYALWKTDRINEYILIREGIWNKSHVISDSSDVFNTEDYYYGQYDEESLVKNIQDLNPDRVSENKSEMRKVRMEDGILMPRFRMITESEWQLAHLAIGDSNYRYLKTPKAYRAIENSDFWYLADMGFYAKAKNEKPINEASSLNKVYQLSRNNYSVYGLNTNISEMVGDTINSYSIGGSFLEEMMNNEAIYNKDVKINDHYFIANDLHAPNNQQHRNTKICGFRLGMDRLGTEPNANQRHRFKPKKK